ncbi:MAG: hypothetical protein ACRD24_15755, partial [Terriglobales bacterium]
ERKSASYRLNAGNSPVINLNRFFRRGPNQFDLWKQFEKVRIVQADTYYTLMRDGRIVLKTNARWNPVEGGSRPVYRVRVNTRTGSVEVYRGWGNVGQCQGHDYKSGWQSAEDYTKAKPCAEKPGYVP